jgi:hypothetical protein
MTGAGIVIRAHDVIRETSDSVLLDYGSGLDCWFSKAEYARLCEIKARPPEARGFRHEYETVLPKRVSQYSQYQKFLYSQIFGEAATEVVFGYGPWLPSVRNRQIVERERARKKKDKS